MKSIGFNNFRKFSHFEPIQLGAVNFFVGRNNAGKSTVEKGMMLLAYNLRNMTFDTLGKQGRLLNAKPTFRFDVDDVHIGTFEKAIHVGAEKREMTFEAQIGRFLVTMTVQPQKEENETSSLLQHVKVQDAETDFEFDFNFSTAEMTLNRRNAAEDEDYNEEDEQLRTYEATKEELELLNKKIADLSAQDIVDTNLLSQYTARREQLDKQLDFLDSKIKKSKLRFPLTVPMEMHIDLLSDNVIANLIRSFGKVRKGNAIRYAPKLQMIANDFDRAVSLERVEYIHATSASQNRILSSFDKNDEMARVVREFNASRDRQAMEYVVNNWMRDFEIGDHFEITPLDGEAFKITVHLADGTRMDLADMGRGSIQLMQLFLHLATLMGQYGHYLVPPTVIIEEPEQNIHPMLQSRLADLLMEFATYPQNQNQNAQPFTVVVETHSEYVIRRTQVMVAQKGYKDEADLRDDNPFHVFYFDGSNAEEPYYEMEYRTNGKFTRKFGTGFFDEANKLIYQTL